MLITRSQLVEELKYLGLKRGAVAMIHGSMSALGYVIGGAESIIHALLDVVGPDGTLMAYIGWQDAPPDDLDELDDESRALYLSEQPIYNPRTARANRSHGRIAEALRTWPGAYHSGHPEAGIAAFGSKATTLVALHSDNDAYGEKTHYAKLIELAGQVVLLGAPLDAITLIHHAEALVQVPTKRRVHYQVPVLVNDKRLWKTFSDIDTGDGILPYETVLGQHNYIDYLGRSALAAGAGKSGPLGNTLGYVFEAQALVKHAVTWIEQNFA